jgi:hypothetical protein
MSQLKVEVARGQLGTGLFLCLHDFDPVSVHCLASAGCEVIEHFAEKAGKNRSNAGPPRPRD